MRRRNENAADRRSVAAMSIRVENEVGNAGGAAGVERLLDAEVVEGVADLFGGDDGDGGEGFLARGENGGGLASGGDEGRRGDSGWVAVMVGFLEIGIKIWGTINGV